MSLTLAQIQAQAAAIAEVSDDYNEAQGGGGGSRLFPAGPVVARLVGYVDFGKQPQEYQGKAKAPVNEFRLSFLLYGPNYTNEDGTPAQLDTWRISEHYSSKSGGFQLFGRMNWKKQATSFPQLIGNLFIVDVKDHTPKKEGSKPYSIIDLKTIRAALDPMSGAEYQAPPAPDSAYQLFSMKLPTLEAWDALKIEGTNDAGESKNWIQDTILSATDFPGSELESLLIQNNRSFVIPAPKAKATAAAAPAGPAPAAPAAAPAGPVVAPQAAPAAVPVAAPVVAAAVAATVVGGVATLSAPGVANPAPLEQAPAAQPAAAPVAAPAPSAPTAPAPVSAPAPTAVAPTAPIGTTTSPSEVVAPVVAPPPAVSLPPQVDPSAYTAQVAQE